MGRPPACCDKLINVKKGIWTEEEDENILVHVSKRSSGPTRCGKSCRPKWGSSCLRANLKCETFTPQEEDMIVRLHATIGSRWPIIAQQLPGRTDIDVKTYWNAKLKKKLTGMGIDPVTHKPFSQILVDCGNMGGLPKSGMRIGIGASLNKDVKNAMLLKSDSPYSQGFSNFNNSLLVPTAKTEPIQATKYDYYQPYDLLTQLQAMKYVTDVSNSNPNPNPITNTNTAPSPLNFYSESSLSSSSSSTCSSAAAQVKPSAMEFGWSGFLLEDAFAPTEASMQSEMAEFSSKEMLNQQAQITSNVGMSCYGMSSNEVEATRADDPCDSSFVEAIVAKENDLFLEFPELLLEEPFYF